MIKNILHLKNIKNKAFLMENKGTRLSRYEVQARLIRMIMEMSDSERKELLNKWEQYRRPEMRKYPRKPAFIPVDCSSFEACFTDFIQDISSGGVFIQTDGNFFVSQQITLTFTIPKAKEDITVSGEVVRVGTQGIGVKFNEPLTTV
ncbi:MAG: PilZ domain-containing protein [Desulfobacterales bacterium]|nr:MAG: PilZ domain-containing protein [Desulfobacterales bacterium]UCD91240.1 MAG: PilZ domain-containing protein [Desulfobacterales bacterium]